MNRGSTGWGPTGRDFAVCLTFDNLGEYAEIQAGVLPPDIPRGSHRSVTMGLPWILESLADRPASFFVEGCSALDYPAAIRAIAACGKEVALHGWMHEASGRCDVDELPLLRRSIDAMCALDIQISGFRPPGGPPGRTTLATLRALGLNYASCVGSASGTSPHVPVLAYQWDEVDAYHFEPHLGPFRESLRGTPRSSSPDEYVRAIDAALHRAATRRSVCVLVFHPYLLAESAYRDAYSDVLRRVDASAAWVASCDDVAQKLIALGEDAPQAVIESAGW